MRRGLVLWALVGCGSTDPAKPAEPPRPIAGKAGTLPLVRGLHQTDRWALLAVPVAFARDGARWIGALDQALALFDGDREVERYPVMVGGLDDQLASLPGGGWIAGSRVLAADGSIRFDGWSWAQRYGRFGSPKASSISPDGSVAILYGADSPGMGLPGTPGGAGGNAGALVRLRLDRERVEERVLAEHPDRVDYAVAASPTAVAAIARGDLSVWPATGDGAPVTAHLDGTTLTPLVFASDRYLVGMRYVDLDQTDVVVLDRDAGWQPVWTWPVPGTPRDLQVRPGGGELAVAWTNYRATDRVLRDDRKVAVFALDGTHRVELDTKGYPASVAWSPRGDALLVAMNGNDPAENAVVRYQVE